MVFGNGIVVLVGDFCLARALDTVAGTGVLPVVKSLAATVTEMAEGDPAAIVLWAPLTVSASTLSSVIWFSAPLTITLVQLEIVRWLFAELTATEPPLQSKLVF